MSLDSFTNLKTALGTWAERTDISDANLTDFVTLADARIRTDLAESKVRTREAEQISDLTPTSGVVTLPTNFMALKRVTALESKNYRLEYKTQDWLDEAYPSGDSGIPSFYTVVGSSLYMFPLTTSDIRITYWAYPDPLGSSQSTNWLLTKYPNVYLYAGLVELDIWAGNDEGVKKWAGAYEEAMSKIGSSNWDDGITPGTSRTSSVPAQ